MCRNKGLIIGIISLFAVIIPGCGNKDDGNPENIRINNWVRSNMDLYYLWNTQMPNADKNLYPSDYFEKLRFSEDRFSLIHDNFEDIMNSLSGVNTESGYDYNLVLLNDVDIIGYVTYIKPNSPAESSGSLKRGDFFMRINGKSMTIDNYEDLLSETAFRHSLGKVNISGNTITEGETIQLDVTEYKENPILLDTIYQINGRKIGYFVYNFFARDNVDSGIAFEKELNDLFGKFKSEGINDLIIDLRYNGGGAVVTSIALASMVSKCTTNDVFSIDQYNDDLHAYYQNYYGTGYNITRFIDRIEKYEGDFLTEVVPINQLGLDRLHVIVSRRTASASELLINGLKPYMDVVIIGNQTYGKNVGSVPFYEEDPIKQQTNKWIILPIIAKFANAREDSGYGNGFSPDIEVSEIENLTLKPLGDTDELMLGAALDRIAGTERRTQKNIKNVKIIGSSADRTPARQNMYITPRR
ncbi:MAG: hypothetical protein LBQ60_19530 [Bacteroidales bacterium]|nr:hypothetical protein [Bacteroidales bacterium]